MDSLNITQSQTLHERPLERKLDIEELPKQKKKWKSIAVDLGIIRKTKTYTNYREKAPEQIWIARSQIYKLKPQNERFTRLPGLAQSNQDTEDFRSQPSEHDQ